MSNLLAVFAHRKGGRRSERAGDAVGNPAGLAGGAAAIDVDENVELAGRFRQLQGLANDHAQRLIGEILVEVFLVDLNLARAGAQVDARRRSLAPSRSVILSVSHDVSSLEI